MVQGDEIDPGGGEVNRDSGKIIGLRCNFDFEVVIGFTVLNPIFSMAGKFDHSGKFTCSSGLGF